MCARIRGWPRSGPSRHEWFFGRERLTSELVGRLAARLEQAGPTGSGWSLRDRASPRCCAPDSCRPWPPAPCWDLDRARGRGCCSRRPQTRSAPWPPRSHRLAGEEPAVVREELVADPRGFAATVRRALRAHAGGSEISGARVVVVVDQFEETFTQCADERDRQVFIRALCAAAGTTDGAATDPGERAARTRSTRGTGRPVRLVRRLPRIAPALQDGQVVLGPMRVPELRAVIERPAATVGLTLQPGLVEVLLRDLGADDVPGERRAGGQRSAGYDPGTLPLLSHAMRVTWEHREDRV